MKVCILTTSFPAYEGHFQSPFILGLARSIADNGVEVDVVCPFYKEGKKKEEVIGKVKVHRFQYLFPVSMQRIYQGGGLPHNLKKSWFSRLELIPYLFFYLMKSIKYGKKADVIHAQWTLSGLVGVFLKKIYQKPLVLSTRGVALSIASKNDLMRPILKFILNNCDLITPNNIHHEAPLRRLGISNEKIRPVPNGVDIALYKPRDKGGLRKRLGIPKNRKVILFVGWFIERKGVDYLIKAFPSVISSNKDAMLYLVGEGSLRESIEDFAVKSGIKDSVKILNPMTPGDIALWMSAADVFVLPSLSEGRPNVIYEAMLSGLPIVATDIGGTNELIQHRKNGLLVKPRDPNGLAEGINLILRNNNFASDIAKKARKHILSLETSWDDCAKKFISIYRLIIKKAEEK